MNDKKVTLDIMNNFVNVEKGQTILNDKQFCSKARRLTCYRPQMKFVKVMFLHMYVILSMVGGRGIPACTTGHMTKHYISSCTGDQSQLVTRQHTGNIKCMMG